MGKNSAVLSRVVVAQVHITGMRIESGVRVTTRELDHKERENQDSSRTPLEYYIHDEADALRFEIVVIARSQESLNREYRKT